MIVVNHNANGQFQTVEFPDTRKGNRDSIKFLEGIKKDRVLHPWYYKLKEIEKLENRIRWGGSRNKAKITMEAELKALQKDRQELLSMTGITCPPPSIES